MPRRSVSQLGFCPLLSRRLSFHRHVLTRKGKCRLVIGRSGKEETVDKKRAPVRYQKQAFFSRIARVRVVRVPEAKKNDNTHQEAPKTHLERSQIEASSRFRPSVSFQRRISKDGLHRSPQRLVPSMVPKR